MTTRKSETAWTPIILGLFFWLGIGLLSGRSFLQALGFVGLIVAAYAVLILIWWPISRLITGSWE